MTDPRRMRQTYFRLSPPLPIHAENFGSGLAHFGNQHELIAHFPDSANIPVSSARIRLDLSKSSHCEFQAALSHHQEKEDRQFRVLPVTPEDQRHLNDAIAKIRKDQHIAICELQDVEASDRDNGLSQLHFRPCALPQLNWSDLQTETDFLGRRFGAPILITGMTGGVERGEDINRRLAAVAAEFRIPMGVGSQRVALEAAEHERVFDVKKHQPDVFLIGNIGIAQIQGQDAVDLAKRAVDMIQADALALHLNVVQELIQVEGDRNFADVLENIARICKSVGVPIIAKECGSGMDPVTANSLKEAGVKAIDVGGKGGTSWGHIEGLRSSSTVCQQVAATFRDWGIPTGHAIAALQQTTKDMQLIATGGIRSGLDVAKTVALGANMAGVGLPFFRAALIDEDHVADVAETYLKALKVTMMATNSRTLKDLSQHIALGKPHLDALNSWFETRDGAYGNERP